MNPVARIVTRALRLQLDGRVREDAIREACGDVATTARNRTFAAQIFELVDSSENLRRLCLASV